MTIRGREQLLINMRRLLQAMDGGAPATLMTRAGSQELAPPSIYEIGE